MLMLFPFLGWLAIATSLVMLGLLIAMGDVRQIGGTVFAAWLLLAAWCQFCGPSQIVAAIGLALQTLLAVCLIVRWRLTG